MNRSLPNRNPEAKRPSPARTRALRPQSGAVVLEYVILLFSIITPLILGTAAMFHPAGDYRGDRGPFGNAFHKFHTNVVVSVGHPTP